MSLKTAFLCSRGRVWARSLALAVLLSSMGQSVPAQSLGPDEVVLYSAQDFAGPAERWQLPAGRLFLSVPFVGEALNQNVASAQVGSEVAVLLFQRPYFTSKDEACGPQIGTDEQPAAWWLGLTAQNLPPPPLQGFAPYSSPRLENGHIGSMWRGCCPGSDGIMNTSDP